MTFKLFISIILFSFVFQATFGQKRDTSVYYLKNSGKVVSTKDSADYMLMILPPDTSINKDLFVLKAYYFTGKPKFIGGSTSNSILNFQGNFMSFFPNGHKKSAGAYDNSEVVGDMVKYYPGGSFYSRQNFAKTNIGVANVLLADCSDSTGKVLAKDGNGYWIVYNDDFSRISEKGKITNGLKDSVWEVTTTDSSGVLKTYKDGKLVTSQPCVISNGKFSFYDLSGPHHSQLPVPEFNKGIDALWKFVARHVKYPDSARKNNTHGKVIASFVVEKNGTLSDIIITRGIGSGCDEEVVRLLKSSPPWQPGMQDGKPVRAEFSISMSFDLAY